MSNNLNPAPVDRHAASKMAAGDADKIQPRKLEEGLAGTCPASDPVPASQPAKSTGDSHPTVVEDGERGPRHARHPA